MPLNATQLTPQVVDDVVRLIERRGVIEGQKEFKRLLRAIGWHGSQCHLRELLGKAVATGRIRVEPPARHNAPYRYVATGPSPKPKPAEEAKRTHEPPRNPELLLEAHLLREAHVPAYLSLWMPGVDLAQLKAMRDAGTGPTWYQVQRTGEIIYRTADIDDWVTRQEVAQVEDMDEQRAAVFLFDHCVQGRAGGENGTNLKGGDNGEVDLSGLRVRGIPVRGGSDEHGPEQPQSGA